MRCLACLALRSRFFALALALSLSRPKAPTCSALTVSCGGCALPTATAEEEKEGEEGGLGADDAASVGAGVVAALGTTSAAGAAAAAAAAAAVVVGSENTLAWSAETVECGKMDAGGPPADDGNDDDNQPGTLDEAGGTGTGIGTGVLLAATGVVEIDEAATPFDW